MLLDQVVLSLIAFSFFSLGRAAIIGSLCLAILGEYMSVGHSRSDCDRLIFYILTRSRDRMDSNEDISPDDAVNMTADILELLNKTTHKIGRFDKNGTQTPFELLADHYLAEIKIIANTKFKPGDPRRIGKARLEKARKRIYELLGYPDASGRFW